MKNKHLRVTLKVESRDSLEIGLLENIEVAWSDTKKQWRVTSRSDLASIFWVGYGDTDDEAILDYLVARLGRGYVYEQVTAYESERLTIDQLSQNIELDKESILLALRQ